MRHLSGNGVLPKMPQDSNDVSKKYSIFVENVEVSGDDETGYTINVDFSDFDSPEKAVSFYRDFLKDGTIGKMKPVYSNSEEAEAELKISDTSGVYKQKEGPENGDWAVDVWRTLNKFGDEYSEEPVETTIKNLAAMDSATVSLAEGDKDGAQSYDFYFGILEELEEERSSEPVRIDVTEYGESETPMDPPYDEEVIQDVGLRWEDLVSESREDAKQLIHEEMVSGTVDDSKMVIEQVDEPDYQGLLEAEKRGKDRKTLKRYLRQRAEEGEDN